MSKKHNTKKYAKPNTASSHIDEFSSLGIKLTSKMAPTSNMLSNCNTFNKERNKRMKGYCAVSKKDNKKKAAKTKPASSHTDEFSSSDGEYIVPGASGDGYDDYSDEGGQYGDTDDL